MPYTARDIAPVVAILAPVDATAGSVELAKQAVDAVVDWGTAPPRA